MLSFSGGLRTTVSFPTATSPIHSAAATARLTTSVTSPQRIVEERICEWGGWREKGGRMEGEGRVEGEGREGGGRREREVKSLEGEAQYVCH